MAAITAPAPIQRKPIFCWTTPQFRRTSPPLPCLIGKFDTTDTWNVWHDYKVTYTKEPVEQMEFWLDGKKIDGTFQKWGENHQLRTKDSKTEADYFMEFYTGGWSRATYYIDDIQLWWTK